MNKIITLEARLGEDATPPNGLYLLVLDLQVESEDEEAWYGVPVLVCCSHHVGHPVGKLPYPKNNWKIKES
jgi:hypothetical protein